MRSLYIEQLSYHLSLLAVKLSICWLLKSQMANMSTFILLSLVALSGLQLGKGDCNLNNTEIGAAVTKALADPFKELKGGHRSMMGYLNRLNKSVDSLSEDFEQQKEEMTDILFHLANSVSILHSAVQTLSPAVEDISRNLSSMRRELTSLNETVSQLSGDLEQHKSQTTSVLADLQTIDSKLVSVNVTSTLMSADLNHVKDNLNNLNESMNKISSQVEEQEDNMTAGLNEIHQSIEETCTHPCGEGNWRLAFFLDMTDPNTHCPEGWRKTDYNKRTCGRASNGYSACDSVTVPVSGGYSQVCGRIKAYQWGWAHGFIGHWMNRNDSAYFSGVAVNHGQPRQHIWSFVAGVAEESAEFSRYMCPCDTTRDIPIPDFVDDDYFCESGIRSISYNRWDDYFSLHVDNPLWDGKGCRSSTCCSQSNPPYFTKTLNAPTTDDIELRMCHHSMKQYEDTAVELVEIYVK